MKKISINNNKEKSVTKSDGFYILRKKKHGRGCVCKSSQNGELKRIGVSDRRIGAVQA